MKEKELVFQGKKIFYRLCGEGAAIFLVHGFGENGNIWKNQYENLEGFRFVVPDLPGSGRSETVEDMSMEGMADVIHAIYMEETRGKEKAVVIGHSMGGYVTLALAEKYEGSLAAIGLAHSTAFADSAEKKDNRRKGIAFIKKNGAAAFLKTAIPNLYGPITKTESPEKIELHLKDSHNFSDAALVSYYVSMIDRPDRTEFLIRSRIPVLLILGRYDEAVPFGESLKLAHMADITYIHILEKSGHMGMVEEVLPFNQYLIAFLEGIKDHEPE